MSISSASEEKSLQDQPTSSALQKRDIEKVSQADTTAVPVLPTAVQDESRYLTGVKLFLVFVYVLLPNLLTLTKMILYLQGLPIHYIPYLFGPSK